MTIRKILIALMLMTLVMAPAALRATVTQITGTLTSNSGPISGKLCVSLPVNSIDTSTSRALSPQATCWPLTNGVLPSFARVVPNDVIQPLNTYYKVWAFNTAGSLIYYANWVVPTGGGTFDMGQALPTTITTTNISYLSPALLNISQTWTATQIFPAGSIAVNELVPGANGTCLQTMSSVAQWITCSVGTAVSVNSVSAGATVNFGNLPAVGANNILGVWQLSGGNASVEVPVTGNGAKAISGTGTYNNGHGVVIDASGNVVDSGATATIVQRATFCPSGCTTTGTPCTTTSGSSDQCGPQTVNWPVAFADTAYAVSCSGIGPVDPTNSPNNGRAYIQVNSKAAGSVAIITVTIGASSIHWTEFDCVGVR